MYKPKENGDITVYSSLEVDNEHIDTAHRLIDSPRAEQAEPTRSWTSYAVVVSTVL